MYAPEKKEISYDIDLPKPHINQQKILKDKTRFRVVACGRRFGKTELAKIAALMRLMRGEKIWFCSPTNENSGRVFREFSSLFKKWDESLVKINRSEYRIELLKTNGEIEFKSLAEPDNLRGTGLNFLVIDEAAFVADHVFDEVLMPMLLDKKGDALFISSTNGRNWFWQKYNYGLADDFEDWVSYRFTTYDNPLIDAKDIDALKKTTNALTFEREYLAEFQEDGGSVFRNITKCVRIGVNEEEFVNNKLLELPPYIIFGIDFGQLNDYTVITVVDAQTGELIEYVRINQLIWEDIHKEIHKLNDKWQPYLIAAESNNSTANIEFLQREGLPILGFRTTVTTKPEMINKLALAFENRTVSIPDDKTLINELSAYSMSKSKSGIIKYSAPAGLHDDICISLAVAFNQLEEIIPLEAFKVLSL